jgi:hypothetical protein
LFATSPSPRGVQTTSSAAFARRFLLSVPPDPGPQPPGDEVHASRTRPFTLFTVLAVILGAAGVVQLFTSLTSALATFGGAALMLELRRILRRILPPE